ncbi:unnamed protein product [Trichobilharzia szidati]|nr:unnamed protein product [Trichobilharzia szidati]
MYVLIFVFCFLFSSTDRRFRPQLKGSTLHTLAYLGEVSSHCRCQLRMTRSASTAAVIGYDFQCCKACEYCHTIGKVGTGHEIMRKNDLNQVNSVFPCVSNEHSDTFTSCTENTRAFLAPPTSSSAYVCTTLPARRCHSNYTAVESDLHPLRVTSCFEPTHFHRSYGNELSDVEQDRIHHNSTHENPFGVSNTIRSEHPFCCCHVMNNAHLPHHHMRLYRRLYSLVDHPCVSLYYPCKYHTCTHTTITSGCSTGMGTSFRNSLSSRHRHTITPVSIYRLSIESRTTSCSKSLDTESDLGLTDASPASNYCSIHQREVAIQSCLQQASAKYKSQPVEETVLGIQRCRRNSDPERWQQFRDPQGNVNENQSSGFSETLTFSNNCENEVSYLSTQLNCPIVNPETGTLGNNGIQSPNSRTNEYVLTNNDAYNDQSVADKTAGTSRASNSVLTTTATTVGDGRQGFNSCQTRFSQSINTLSSSCENPTICHYSTRSGIESNPPVEQQQQQQQQYRFQFRPSVLLSSTEHATTTTPPIMYTSDTCFSLHSPNVSLCQRAQSTSASATVASVAGGDDVSIWSDGVGGDGDDDDLLLKTNIIQSASNNNDTADCLPVNSSNSGGYGPTDPIDSNGKPQLISDISVNELASYMEHMVHIPGRMSEMAQRMYL